MRHSHWRSPPRRTACRPTADGTGTWCDVAVSPVPDRQGRAERLLVIERDITRTKGAEDLLRAVTEGTASVAGTAFFSSFVRHLALALNVRRVFVAECLPGNRARSRAVFLDREPAPNYEYDLAGTPCMKVVAGQTCLYSHDVRKYFPYLGYDTYDFAVPTQTAGDVYARYQVRMEEMRQSIRIIRQCLRDMPGGPVNVDAKGNAIQSFDMVDRAKVGQTAGLLEAVAKVEPTLEGSERPFYGRVMTDDKRVVLPDKSNTYGNIEGLMNHFKLIMEGPQVPPRRHPLRRGLSANRGLLPLLRLEQLPELPACLLRATSPALLDRSSALRQSPEARLILRAASRQQVFAVQLLLAFALLRERRLRLLQPPLPRGPSTSRAHPLPRFVRAPQLQPLQRAAESRAPSRVSRARKPVARRWPPARLLTQHAAIPAILLIGPGQLRSPVWPDAKPRASR